MPTFKHPLAELYAIRAPTGVKFLQYLYLQDSDETPSAIQRKDTKKSNNVVPTAGDPRALTLYTGSQLHVSTAMVEQQSKILQSRQKWSMLFQLPNGHFQVITGDTINWLQLMERIHVRFPM